jgi:hypothetical protein
MHARSSTALVLNPRPSCNVDAMVKDKRKSDNRSGRLPPTCCDGSEKRQLPSLSDATLRCAARALPDQTNPAISCPRAKTKYNTRLLAECPQGARPSHHSQITSPVPDRSAARLHMAHPARKGAPTLPAISVRHAAVAVATARRPGVLRYRSKRRMLSRSDGNGSRGAG